MSELLLEAKNVSKKFQRKDEKPIQVLSGVDFNVGAHDRIAIVGKSGAGKSTLLHLLGTLESPDQGTILFEGKNIFEWPESKLSLFRNKKIGFVFQFHYLMLEFTALENVMMPGLISGQSKRAAQALAENLLKQVGLSDRKSHKPGQLSGGEQQRVAIARALMMKPRLLLTDEMTGNLDGETGREVCAVIDSLHRTEGLAIVSVTHDTVLAGTYPRVYRLQDGALLPQ